MGNLRKQMLSVIAESEGRDFVYGEWDCCIFCFECLIPDQVGLIKGKYDDHDGAQAKIEELGGYDKCVKDLGGEPVELGYLQSADLVELDLGEDIENPLGVYQGGAIVCNQYKGLVRYPKKFAVRAWRFS